MKQLGVAALKNGLSKHLRAVEAGEEIEVMDRSRPIARIVPVERRRGERRSLAIRPARHPFADVRDRRYEALPGAVDSLAILLEERGDR